MSRGEGAGDRRGIEQLRLRIERTRAITGNHLRCSKCSRLSIGRASGWTMRPGEDDSLETFCPDCDELEFG